MLRLSGWRSRVGRVVGIGLREMTAEANANPVSGPPPPGLEHLAWPAMPEDLKYSESAPDGVTVVGTRSEAERVLSILSKLPPETWHAWDTEVSMLDLDTQSPVVHGEVICASFYSGPNIDFGRGPRVFVDNYGDSKGVLSCFKEFLEQKKVNLTFHNFGFDRHVLYRAGIDVTSLGADTMHMARMWDSARATRGGYSLESLSEDLLLDRKIPMKERFSLPKLKRDGTPGKDTELPPVEVLQTDVRFRREWIDYATYDAEATWRVRNVLEDKLRAREWVGGKTQWDFAQKYTAPFAVVLTDLEREGIYVDVEHHLPRAESLAREEKLEAEKRFLQWAQRKCEAAERMNVASDVQKAHFLFAPARRKGGSEEWPRDRAFKVDNVEEFVEEGKTKPKKQRDMVLSGLGIPAVARTASGWPAVSATVLRKLAGDLEADPPRYGLAYEHFGGGKEGAEACEAISALVEYAAVDTMLSNFLIPLQMMADSESRIHCSLNLNTETGRLSARRPNLQNQPALDKDRYKIRQAFRAPPGRKLIVADYGQLELRILAHMARCKSMIEAFEAGGDFHSRTALGMYPHVRDAVEKGQVRLEETDESDAPLLKTVFATERRKAKVLNFSIAYGKTAMGLSRDWGVSLDEAKDTLERWYADRPEVRQWQQRVLESARATGSTRTLMGRHRDLPDINLRDFRKRGRAERAAINTPIQGGAADVVMMAMLRIHGDPELQSLGWKMLLQIHDEVILEGPQENANKALERVQHCMAHPFQNPLLVELTTDASIADTWYDGK